MTTLLRKWYPLVKPGIVLGNSLPVLGGFSLGSHGTWEIPLLLATLLGMALIISSACVLNNIFDRSADEKMKRTQTRPLVVGIVSISEALILAVSLGCLGIFLLAMYTPLITLVLALLGMSLYLLLYTPFKYQSHHGTLVGSLSGAIPPVAGYAAATDHLDGAALLLFVLLIFWQMPHFFAIALYRAEEFQAAQIPVLPLKKGVFRTKVQMVAYVFGFVFLIPLLYVFGHVGVGVLSFLMALGIGWIALSFFGFWAKEEIRWAKRMFAYSLQMILGLSLALVL